MIPLVLHLVRLLPALKTALKRSSKFMHTTLNTARYVKDLKMTDIIDRANQEADLILESALNHAKKDRYSRIRITEATDPITGRKIRSCSDCDALISQARLEVRPNAALCVDCQSVREKKEH